MEKAFRIAINNLIAGLIVTMPLYLVLFASDSEEYRSWVMIQMSLQFFGIIFLFYVRSYKIGAVILFILVLLPFQYINAIYVNYGDRWFHEVTYSLFWLIYGGLLYGVRHKFKVEKKDLV